MKKTLFLSAIMFLFSLTMIVGTTYAWYNEDVTVNNNRIIMGELGMDVTYTDPTMDTVEWYEFTDSRGVPRELFDVTGAIGGIQPGSVTQRAIRIENTGNILLAVRFITSGTTSVPTELEPLLEDAIQFSAKIAQTTHTGSMINYKSQVFVLEPGEVITFPITVTVDSSLGNDYELAQMNFDFTIQGRQLLEVEAGQKDATSDFYDVTQIYDYNPTTNTFTLRP